MDRTKALQKLLDGTAAEEEIALLKQALSGGELSISGNVNNSVLTVGTGNNVQVIQLTPETLDRLDARPLLGNLDRELMAEEIAAGLRRLDKLLPNRAPVLLPHYKDQVGRLRAHLKTETKALSELARRERVEALAAINSICLEAVDISFNSLCLGDDAPKYESHCPFRGLESFRVEDREFFFGREELTKKLVAKIQSHPFLAVLGASGSGKSSLVMAGMIPALTLDYAIIRPGTNPLDALDSARGKSLLVVDQFEELFTFTRDEKTRADFISALLDLTKRSRILITLRSDFLGEAGAYRSLSGEIQNHLEIIPPMNADELRRAMEGQARWARLEFEADLSQQILDNVAGEPGAMPLLQHALWELWNRRHGRNLRANEYRAFGGVKQAITSTAEKVYADCSRPEQDQMRDIFLRLTRLDDGDEGRDTRRRVSLGDLIPSGRDAASISALLDKLANARLIVKTVNSNVTEIEVAHEALIRHWERLRLWLNEDRGNLRLRESIHEAARHWDEGGRRNTLINHQGARLELAISIKDSRRYLLNELEQEYLDACLFEKERFNKIKSNFISISAHELRTPLTLIMGYAQMLEMDTQANPELSNLVRGILEGSERMTDVVESMLDVSRIDSEILILKRTELRIDSLVQKVESLFAKAFDERNIGFSVDGLRELPAIFGDLELLQKVFYHLIINAIKFTPDGGRISVEGRHFNNTEAPYVELTVQDTGIGIDQDSCELIFEKFSQTGEVLMHSSGKTKYKSGGPGLGLAISRGIVIAHGGKIWVESPGCSEEDFPGSAFHFTLPITNI